MQILLSVLVLLVLSVSSVAKKGADEVSITSKGKNFLSTSSFGVNLIAMYGKEVENILTKFAHLLLCLVHLIHALIICENTYNPSQKNLMFVVTFSLFFSFFFGLLQTQFTSILKLMASLKGV